MKTERRHELQTNELADWLGKWIKILAPYSRALLAGVIALIVLVALAIYWRTQAAERQALGWNDFFGAITSNETGRLETVADEFGGQAVGVWSRLLLADIELQRGVEMMFSDRAQAKERLRNARQSYLTASNEADDPMLRDRAVYGMAQASEALGEKDDLDQAMAHYQRLIDERPDGVFAEQARQRIDDLNQDSTKQFLDWFAQQSPTAMPSTLFPGTPGEGPLFDDSSLPTGPIGDGVGEFQSPFGLSPSTPGADSPDSGETFRRFDPLDSSSDESDAAPPDSP